jgi:hypothetical protein
MERDEAALGVGLYFAGEQPIERERLVVAAGHQAFDHVTADRLRRDPSYDERIEVVEGPKHALDEAPALRCGRVSIREAREIFG